MAGEAPRVSIGLPVLAPEDAAAVAPARILVLNPVYLEEMRTACAAHGIDAELIALAD